MLDLYTIAGSAGEDYVKYGSLGRVFLVNLYPNKPYADLDSAMSDLNTLLKDGYSVLVGFDDNDTVYIYECLTTVDALCEAVSNSGGLVLADPSDATVTLL